jgi:hypothetical protein
VKGFFIGKKSKPGSGTGKKRKVAQAEDSAIWMSSSAAVWKRASKKLTKLFIAICAPDCGAYSFFELIGLRCEEAGLADIEAY